MGTAFGFMIAERIAGRNPGVFDFPRAAPSLPWGLAGLWRS